MWRFSLWWPAPHPPARRRYRRKVCFLSVLGSLHGRRRSRKYYKLKIYNSIKEIKYKNYTLSCDRLSTLQMCKEIKRIINNGDHIFKKNNYNSKKNKISKIDDYKYNDLQLTELSQIARY